MSDPNVPGQPVAPPHGQAPQQPVAPQQPAYPQPGYPPQQPVYPQPGYPPQQPGYPPQWAAPGAAPEKSGGRLKPPVVIGVVVAVVALVGGGIALFGASRDQEERGSVIPADLPVLDPTVGPQPADPVEPEPGPGPGPDPVVTTTTAPEPEEPDQPGQPDTPVTPTGDTVEVGAGVSVAIPSGWTLANQGTGEVQLNADTGDGQLFVTVFDSSIGSTAPAAISNYLDIAVTPYVSELQMSEVSPFSGTSASVVDGAMVEYAGVQVGQSGNIPVEGFVIVWVRQDGSVVIYEEFNLAGAYEALQPAYHAMQESLVASL